MAAALALPATAGAVAQPIGPGGLDGAPCTATRDAAAAASALYGRGTTLVREERVAGLRTALALEPYIAPGTRQRLVRAGSGWCDAASGLNRAWRRSGRRVGDGRALAAAYVRLAAAPYFDGVRVRSHRVLAPGVHRITTHARTNGVVATWTVVTDATGVRSATWRATRLGVRPFTRELEGLTALPGASERYTRVADGLLSAVRGLPSRRPAPGSVRPEPQASYTTSDGFTVMTSVGESRAAVDVGADTGEPRLDVVRELRDIVGENLEEFLRWGLRSEWSPAVLTAVVARPDKSLAVGPQRTGYLFINDSTSLYCFACVFIGDDFNIHVLSEFGVVLTALGYSYPPGKEREAFSDVLGHEIFHNFQNSYVKPDATGRSVPGSYSEGTARFQETLHSYAEISHQEGSLLYADDANGCNGYHATAPEVTFAQGPLEASYASCNFWLAFYGTFGQEAFVRLVTTAVPQGALERKKAGEERARILRGIELATGRSVHEAAAAWARAVITGKFLSWAAPLGGPRLDWGRFLERWEPDTIGIGQTVSGTLSGGGVLARRITTSARLAIASKPVEPAQGEQPAGGEPRLAVLRDSAAGATLTSPQPGETVPGPGAGETVHVLVTRADPGEQEVTLTLYPPAPPAVTRPVPVASRPLAARPSASCRRDGARQVTCRLRRFGAASVSARVLGGSRTVATGRTRLRRGSGTLRLRARRALPRARLVVVLTAPATASSPRVVLRRAVNAR